MTSFEEEYLFRARQLQNLDFQDATSRLVGFVEWLESNERTARILKSLRSIDLDPLLKNASYQQPPKPKNPEQVAGIALAMIDHCKEKQTDLFQVGFGLGIHASSSRVQDTHDEISQRYIVPFLDYVAVKLAQEAKPEQVDRAGRAVAVNAKDIFVVHGRDEAAKQTVARFLERLGLNPIILHEQPNRGRTIVEKFEDHAEVAFAIIILTPDDVGRLASEPESISAFRPRQNVVFEMGYFLGRIGRQQVFPLTKGKLDIPSDYGGVVYTELDDKGAWQIPLVRELKVAGFDVDANKVFG